MPKGKRSLCVCKVPSSAIAIAAAASDDDLPGVRLVPHDTDYIVSITTVTIMESLPDCVARGVGGGGC